MKLDNYSRMAFKGSSVFEFITVLEIMVDKNLIIELADLDVEEPEPNFTKNFLIEYMVTIKLKDFISREFNISEVNIEEFKHKSFRGNKLLNIVEFFEHEIHYHDCVIKEFSNVSLLKEELSNHFTQLEFYKELKSFFIACFFKRRKNRKEFINIWVNDFLKKNYEVL